MWIFYLADSFSAICVFHSADHNAEGLVLFLQKLLHEISNWKWIILDLLALGSTSVKIITRLTKYIQHTKANQ